MFSDFVNFKEVELIVNNEICKHNFGLVALDISHDNEIYQLFIANLTEGEELLDLTNFLKHHVSKDKQISLKINYQLKQSKNQIIDLYDFIPDKNNWLSVTNKEKNEIFIFKCHLKTRNYVGFDYQVDKVANY